MGGRVLYIGFRIDKIEGGADIVNTRNKKVLESVFPNKVDYFEFQPKGGFDKLFFGIGWPVMKEVLQCLSQSSYKYVFLSQSLFGRLAKLIKRKFPEIKIITFFHNIEIQYAREYLKVSGIRAIPFYLAVRYWERVACEKSDILITLNKRDSDLLERLYNKKASFELPTSFEDNFDEDKAQESQITDNPIDYLFVGMNFFANVQAVQWFIDNVMPNVKGHFYVVGKGMDKVDFSNLNDRIHIEGFVEDLSEYYYRARFVVSPIFSGGGMKTKTAEALMYGKTILGTKEAFEGYEKDERCMIECNDAASFIDKLSAYDSHMSLNIHSRRLFMKYYSFDSSLEIMKANLPGLLY